MTREEMLQALQADVDAWPQRVRDRGVKPRDGRAYRPLPRNNEILRTPDRPEATYAYMLGTWGDANADAEAGSEGWDRILAQAGPEYTWEWLMADPWRPYAELFSPEIRARVRRALGVDPELGPTLEQDDVVGAIRPRRAGRTRSYAERRAIEVRAVQAVTERLTGEGWSVEDVGATRSYDLHCSALNGRELFVEVKGTTGPLSAVVLTLNEVELARREHPDTALYVVHDIELLGGAENPTASGGTIHEVRPWLPEESRLKAAVFSYRLGDLD